MDTDYIEAMVLEGHSFDSACQDLFDDMASVNRNLPPYEATK